MGLDLVSYERKAQDAIITFWQSRAISKQKQLESGKADQGERSGVTSGKNMDGFLTLITDIVLANGLNQAQVHQKRSVLTLPGYFRPTKLWDLLITYQGKLIAAIELKSQVGPSFGNNFNNRTEEAIGTAQDFWTAYREGAFGQQSRPFVGWLMLVEDERRSRSPVRNRSPHFPVFPEFDGTSYLERYDLFCQKLMREQLYTHATLITSSKVAISNGQFSDISTMTSLKSFVTAIAGHVAVEAARLG